MPDNFENSIKFAATRRTAVNKSTSSRRLSRQCYRLRAYPGYPELLYFSGYTKALTGPNVQHHSNIAM